MEDGGYRLLEHTGDLRVIATGRSFSAVTTALLRALAEAAYGRGDPAKADGALARSIPIRPDPDDPPLALVEILNEALFRMEVERLVPVAFEGDADGGLLHLAAPEEGLEPVREVKAATYSDTRCEPTAGGRWIAEVTFDL